MEIDHEYTKEIVCPHCGYEKGDSWEMPDYSKEEHCSQCDNKFSYERDVDVTYVSQKL